MYGSRSYPVREVCMITAVGNNSFVLLSVCGQFVACSTLFFSPSKIVQMKSLSKFRDALNRDALKQVKGGGSNVKAAACGGYTPYCYLVPQMCNLQGCVCRQGSSILIRTCESV